MNFHEKQRIRKNKKVRILAKKVLQKCEAEEYSMADLKDFAYTLQSMIDETLLLNEENHKLKHFHSTVEVSQNNNSDIHQRIPENRHPRQE